MTTSVPLARRQFLSQSTSLTLSAAAVGVLAGAPRFARAQSDSAKDTAFLNVALGLEYEAIAAGAQPPADGVAFAQATMLFESLITVPSSRTRTGTKLSPVNRLTSFRPLVMSGNRAKPYDLTTRGE